MASSARRLDPKISGLSFDKDDHQGCLWGVLHVLRSYQWQSVKKMMPNKRITSRKQTGSMRYSRLRSDIADTGEAQGSMDADGDDVNIRGVSESSQTNKTSGKVHMKNLIVEEMSKIQDDRHPLPNFRSHFMRTESIHHLEPSSHMLPDAVREDAKCLHGVHQSDDNTTESSWDPFLLKIPNVTDACCNSCEMCSTMASVKNLSHKQLDELGRQLLDNALLQNKLERAKESFSRQKSASAKESSKDGAHAHHTQALQGSNAKGVKPTKLKYTQEDFECFDDNGICVLKQDKEIPDIGQASTSGPQVELKKRRFKDIKRKIKNAIKESRKEGHRISMDAIFHKMPYGSRFSKDVKRDVTDESKDPVVNKGEIDSPTSNSESNNSTPSIGNARLNSIRRSQSLNDSLDRYTQLFEISFGRGTKKQPSDSLKLANGRGVSSFSTPKILGRILSLPDLDSYSSLQLNGSSDALSSRIPNRNFVDNSTSIGSSSSIDQKEGLIKSTENHIELDQLEENEKQENLVVVVGNDLENPMCEEGSSVAHCEQGIGPADHENNKPTQPSPISVLESCFQENISSPDKISVSTGPDLTPLQIHGGELDYLSNLHDQSVTDSSNGALNQPELENSKIPNADFWNVRVDKKDEADFQYVRDVLKLSGLTGNAYLGTWYSPEQPVGPSLFEEVETCSPLKSDNSVDEVSSSYNHQLLFDIINEVLLEIYDKSFTYWSRSLSCNCHIRPRPTGYHVLEEVWATIRWYLNSQPEFQPLDYLVVRDLSKNDGWMNLQFDSECVGLELEEMILDDLLDEFLEA